MLAAGYQSFSASSAGITTPVDFSFNLSGLLDTSDKRWMTLGEVTLWSRIRWAIIIEDNYSRSEQYHNPSRLQLGWLSYLTDGYVREQRAIRHLQEEKITTSPNVYVRGSLMSYPMRMEREGGGGQSIGINDNLWCGCVGLSGQLVPAPGVSSIDGEISIGQGRWRQRIYHGKDTYRQNTDIYDLPGAALSTSALDFGFFDQIQGVLYPGLTMGLTVEHFWPQVQSNIIPIAPPPIITATPDIPVYDYTCLAGASIPIPTNPPCPPDQLDANGGYTFSCGANA